MEDTRTSSFLQLRKSQSRSDIRNGDVSWTILSSRYQCTYHQHDAACSPCEGIAPIDDLELEGEDSENEEFEAERSKDE